MTSDKQESRTENSELNRKPETLFQSAFRNLQSAISYLLLVTCHLSLVTVLSASAQQRASRPQQKSSTQTAASDELARTRAAFIKATKEYKESLNALIALLEKNVKSAADEVEKDRKLYEQGLISRRKLEESEQKLQTAQTEVAARRKELADADKNIADTLLEAEAEEKERLAQAKAANNAARNSRGSIPITATATMMRYNGAGVFSLATGAARVEQFFASRFGRALPISAFGQTAVHDRLGFDHHNALDVGVSPDSAEGQALIAFLEANRIPFIAFRHAVPGSATGAHIHIGLPSHRIAR